MYLVHSFNFATTGLGSLSEDVFGVAQEASVYAVKVTAAAATKRLAATALSRRNFIFVSNHA
jgi:hypothetical protein